MARDGAIAQKCREARALAEKGRFMEAAVVTMEAVSLVTFCTDEEDVAMVDKLTDDIEEACQADGY